MPQPGSLLPPVVLCLSGHDPSGGAGVQADIEALRAQGAHPATVITTLTLQDSRNAYAVDALEPGRLLEQAELLLEDLPVAAVKLGLLGSDEQALAVAGLLRRHPQLPVVLDPVLRAGGGAALADQPLANAIVRELLPLAAVATPNLAEAQQLSGQRGRADSAAALLAAGATALLITGGDEAGAEVVNSLHRPGVPPREWRWPRLPQRYHGSGCTLAAALAARLAHGEALEDALDRAQDYTWRTLRDAYRIGRGQHFPRRLA